MVSTPLTIMPKVYSHTLTVEVFDQVMTYGVMHAMLSRVGIFWNTLIYIWKELRQNLMQTSYCVDAD